MEVTRFFFKKKLGFEPKWRHLFLLERKKFIDLSGGDWFFLKKIRICTKVEAPGSF